MNLSRRQFLAGLTATAAGVLIPERKVWALDRTMLFDTRYPDAIVHPETDYNFFQAFYVRDEVLFGNAPWGQYKTNDGENWIRILGPAHVEHPEFFRDGDRLQIGGQ
jgi:hypothetical protein